MKNIEDLENSKYLFVRHIGYFLISIGLISLSIILFVFTILFSIIWCFYDGYNSFIEMWKEYFKLLHEIWLKK